MDSQMQAERQHVQDTVRRIGTQLRALAAVPRYHGDDLVEQSVDDIRQQQVQRLQKAQPSPYFGRLDFEPLDGHKDASNNPERFYIGKVGIQDEQSGDIVVVDWRAPISSLFYSFSGEDAEISYSAPEGQVFGRIHRKRNLAIENQQLIRMVDSYVRGESSTGLADEFLLYRLSEHKDAKLRDIVSTIQAEQDKIIRGPRERAMFIQGVAGSGKTTVALHRLAYLLYEYHDRVRADKMMVFAPNQMFLNYIADVLPELGVGDIAQTTFTDWAVEVLHPRVSVVPNADRYERWFKPAQRPDLLDDVVHFDAVHFKGSLDFQAHLQATVEQALEAFVPVTDFSPWTGCVLPAETIHQWFLDEYRQLAPNPRRERVLARLNRFVQTSYRDIEENDPRGALRKSAQAKVKTFAKSWQPLDVIKLYQAALAKHETYGATVKPIKKSGGIWQVRQEDLAPLVFLQDTIEGRQNQAQFHHVVFDEAQDFAPLQLSVIAARTPSNSFTILGDLSQSIFPELGISSWAELMDVFGEDVTDYFELNRSYRSTMEIVQFANDILAKHAVVTPAVPVFRSGHPVMASRAEPRQFTGELVRSISEARKNGAQSVAVLVRGEDEAEAVWRSLQIHGVQATHISVGNEVYEGGLSVLPIFLSKGLEFDAVILANVNATNYPDDALSAKLLYVGCTRALHWLHVVTTGTVSPLLATALTQ